jgi:hypothetical protein
VASSPSIITPASAANTAGDVLASSSSTAPIPLLQPIACDARPPAIALQQAVHEASADQRRPVRVRLPQRLAATRDRCGLSELAARLVREAEHREDQPAQRVLRHAVEQREGALERLLDVG